LSRNGGEELAAAEKGELARELLLLLALVEMGNGEE
jgi:hypothetical protein